MEQATHYGAIYRRVERPTQTNLKEQQMKTYAEQYRELLTMLKVPINEDGWIDSNAENVLLEIDENGHATYTIKAIGLTEGETNE